MIAEPPLKEGAWPDLLVPGEVTALVLEKGVEALIAERSKSEEWQKIEAIEHTLSELPQQKLPLNHLFGPGWYCRSICLPAETLLTSRIHLFSHPFIISMGAVSVWSDACGWELMRASHVGVTTPGTRRILYAHTDVIWTTVHLNPTNETDPDEIVKRVTWSEGKYKELGASRS